MKSTSLSTRLLIPIVYCSILFSCTSKIPYGSTYYFPLEPVAKNEKVTAPEEVKQEPGNIIASVEKIAPIAPSTEFMLEKAHDNMAQITKTTPSEGATAQLSDKKTGQNLSKKELKQERKEARKALKQAVKEYKHDIKEQKKENAQKALTKTMKIGIVLAAVGLILLILPLGYAGYILGTIGLVVGLILILIEAL